MAKLEGGVANLGEIKEVGDQIMEKGCQNGNGKVGGQIIWMKGKVFIV